MKTITVTELRGNIYNLLEEVLTTGIPLEINKGGRKLRIAPVEKGAAEAEVGMGMGTFEGGGGGGGGSRSDESEKAGAFPEL